VECKSLVPRRILWEVSVVLLFLGISSPDKNKKIGIVIGMIIGKAVGKIGRIILRTVSMIVERIIYRKIGQIENKIICRVTGRIDGRVIRRI
jgi:uncharacterized membrane protein (Fun14 family)